MLLLFSETRFKVSFDSYICYSIHNAIVIYKQTVITSIRRYSVIYNDSHISLELGGKELDPTNRGPSRLGAGTRTVDENNDLRVKGHS